MTQSKDLAAYRRALKDLEKKHGVKKKPGLLSKLRLGAGLGIAIPVIRSVVKGIARAQAGQFLDIPRDLAYDWFGTSFDAQWRYQGIDPQAAAGTWIPIVMGCGASYVARKTGVNRMIPYLNI